jgi:hypothetical protein
VVEGSGVDREVLRPSKLVFTWFADHKRQETPITVTFQPQGAGTVMHFRQEGLPDGGAARPLQRRLGRRERIIRQARALSRPGSRPRGSLSSQCPTSCI